MTDVRDWTWVRTYKTSSLSAVLSLWSPHLPHQITTWNPGSFDLRECGIYLQVLFDYLLKEHIEEKEEKVKSFKETNMIFGTRVTEQQERHCLAHSQSGFDPWNPKIGIPILKPSRIYLKICRYDPPPTLNLFWLHPFVLCVLNLDILLLCSLTCKVLELEGKTILYITG